jgi:hypothetical protein
MRSTPSVLQPLGSSVSRPQTAAPRQPIDMLQRSRRDSAASATALLTSSAKCHSRKAASFAQTHQAYPCALPDEKKILALTFHFAERNQSRQFPDHPALQSARLPRRESAMPAAAQRLVLLQGFLRLLSYAETLRDSANPGPTATLPRRPPPHSTPPRPIQLSTMNLTPRPPGGSIESDRCKQKS